MFSPLRVRYLLLQEFPQLADADFYIISDHQVGVLLIFCDGEPFDEAPKTWVEKVREIGLEYIVVNDTPSLIEGKVNISTEAEDLDLDIDFLTDQRVNDAGFLHYLRKRLPGVRIESLSIYDGPGTVTLFIEDEYLQNLTAVEKHTIERLAHLLFCARIGIFLRPLSSMPKFDRHTRELEKVEESDWCQYLDLFSATLNKDSFHQYYPQLPSNSLYLDLYTDRQDLFPHFVLSKNIFMAMPFQANGLERKYHITFAEFKKLLATGKIVPVFEEQLDRYDERLVLDTIASSPRTVLPGELRLRLTRAVVEVEPLLGGVERRDPVALGCLRGVAKLPEPAGQYLGAIHETAKRFRHSLTSMQPIAQALFPLIDYTDKTIRAQLKAMRGLEISERVLEFATAYRAWLICHALRTELTVNHDEPLSGFFNLYFNRPTVPEVEAQHPQLLQIGERMRWLLGRLGFLGQGMSITEHAKKSIHSDVVSALRELVQSPRLSTEDYKTQIDKIESEVQSIRRKLSMKSWAVFISGALSVYYGDSNPLVQILAASPAMLALASKLYELADLSMDYPDIDRAFVDVFKIGSPEARLLFKIRQCT